MKFDYLVLGNGAIGMFAAIQIKNAFPSASVGIIGSAGRPNSASVAAGAMCNVYGEIEHSFSEQMKTLQEISFQYGIKGKAGWLDFVAKFNLEGKLITAKDTLIFLKPNPSEFESRNFSRSKEKSKTDSVLRSINSSEFSDLFKNVAQKPEDAFIVESEFALDSGALFTILSSLIDSLGIELIDSTIIEIDTSLKIVVTDREKVSSHKFVVALGAATQDYLVNHKMQKILRGVGTAIEISNNDIDSTFAKNQSVIRTVNRGGAQCGFHFVPRFSGFYLGAGNYIRSGGQSAHRLETIRYLINTFEKELAGSDITYQIEGGIIKGHRPRALDGFPMIGPLSEAQDFFVVSGTNRAGLTWAPAIASQIVDWCRGEHQGVLPTNLARMILPDRSPIDFGLETEAIEYYVESRVGAAIEHGRIENQSFAIDSEKKRIKDYAFSLLDQVRQVSGDFKTPHPDHWASITDNPSLCVP